MTCTAKCVLFDLDGTLVNTIIDLGRSVDYVLTQFGREAKWSEDDYRSFVGNGARVLVDRAFEHTLNEENLDKAFAMFKAKYNEILLDNAYAYKGVSNQLVVLREKGIRLAVVTNKPHEAAVKMVNTIFPNGTFDFIIGGKPEVPKKPDAASALIALEQLGCEADEAVFFGDSDIDIFTAYNAGISKAIACSWGYRPIECLKSANPFDIIDSPEYICRFF